MNLKKIWPLEDNILILRQALVKIAGNTVEKKLIRPMIWLTAGQVLT